MTVMVDDDNGYEGDHVMPTNVRINEVDDSGSQLPPSRGP